MNTAPYRAAACAGLWFFAACEAKTTAPGASVRNLGPLRSEAVNLSIPASEFVVFSLGPKTA